MIFPKKEQGVDLANSGVFVTPVKSSDPILRLSFVRIREPASMLFASTKAASCGRGEVLPPAPPDEDAHRVVAENAPVDVPPEATQYLLTGVVNVMPELPPASPEPPVTADKSHDPAPAPVMS